MKRRRRAAAAIAIAGAAMFAMMSTRRKPVAFAGASSVPAAACVDAERVAAIAACLGGDSPDACETGHPRTGTPCDRDGDSLDDDLEEALARAYAPAFAFDSSEDRWPASTSFFVAHATLRHGGTVIAKHPSLAALAESTAMIGTETRRAIDPGLGAGAEFWLCLDDHSPSTLLTTSSAMLAAPGGVELLSVVHAAGPKRWFVSYTMLWTHNHYAAGVDDHEGDSETAAIFVNRATGAVDAAFFDHHESSDATRYVDVATFGAHDPAEKSTAHGLRFADFSGARRHAVVYVSAGGHAPYDVPGNTPIWRVGIGPRDAHDGAGATLLPWLGVMARDFAGKRGVPIAFTHTLVGEPSRITADWARFRGQWGCDDGLVGMSYPLPFGNARHARPLYDKSWD